MLGLTLMFGGWVCAVVECGRVDLFTGGGGGGGATTQVGAGAGTGT